MSSETTRVAEQCRLREWAAQIRECQSRPAGISVAGWCASHGITKANYYYRLRRPWWALSLPMVFRQYIPWMPNVPFCERMYWEQPP